jgi:L-Ala-D/L-Glu epimerase
MKLLLHEIELPLRHAFTITHGTTTVKRNLLVELREGNLSGWGEAAPSLAYRHISAETIRAALEAERSRIESLFCDRPEELWDALDEVLGKERFAQCALDEAAHDLWGKLHGKPVWELWGLKLENLPVSNYTIGIASIPEMVAKLQEFADWPIFKIKLGTTEDVAIVRELRRHTDAKFRIDANTAWTVEQTLEYAPKLKELGVEFLEQPLPAADWDGMKRLFRECPLPIIADESCQVERDVERCAGHFHGINIKLSKAGGLTPARRMIARARELGLSTMAGCMVETSVGISAQAQLLPLLDLVDLDGALLLGKDLATGVTIERGHAQFPQAPGTGVTEVRIP